MTAAAPHAARPDVPVAAMIAALAGGVTIGAIVAGAAPGAVAVVQAIATPVGALWLGALTMTIVPLVFALVVGGILGAAEAGAASGLARRAIGWFAVLLVACGLGGALFTALFLAWWPAPGAIPVPPGTATPAVAGADAWYAGLFVNPVRAAAETAMLPLVLFALLFGLAAARIAPEQGRGVARAMETLTATMLVIVRWVLLAAPVGILALAIGVGTRGGAGLVGTLGHYVLAVAGACLSAVVLPMLAAWAAGGLSPVRFARAAAAPQAVALGTQSSLATLPAMLAAAPRLGVAPERAGIVLPLAVSLFRAASSAGNAAVALYVLALSGAPVTPGTVAVAGIVSAGVSLAAVGLPSHVSFFTATVPVCLAVGAPVEVLPILLAIETIPDLFRTLGNVTADLAVTRIVGRGSLADGAALGDTGAA